VFYVDSQSGEFLVLAAYATILLLIDPTKYLFGWRTAFTSDSDIGRIIGVQSKRTFLAKLHKKRVPTKRFDLVQFRYSMDEEHRTFSGVIIDNFLLNQEQWIKILRCEKGLLGLTKDFLPKRASTNVVYKVVSNAVGDFLIRFVGVVVEGSIINKLKFDYAGRNPIYEGTLLQVDLGRPVLYQVVQGTTNVEKLESKNEAVLSLAKPYSLVPGKLRSRNSKNSDGYRNSISRSCWLQISNQSSPMKVK
jgi:hypothetical protein